MHKYSSTVVEKCLDVLDFVSLNFYKFFKDYKNKIIKELFKLTKIGVLLKNKFGVYVLQKAVSVMDIGQKKDTKEYLSKKLSSFSKQEKQLVKNFITML